MLVVPQGEYNPVLLVAPTPAAPQRGWETPLRLHFRQGSRAIAAMSARPARLSAVVLRLGDSLPVPQSLWQRSLLFRGGPGLAADWWIAAPEVHCWCGVASTRLSHFRSLSRGSNR